MTKEEVLKAVSDALIDSGKFADVAISDDGTAVLFNDENYDCWALTPEQFR